MSLSTQPLYLQLHKKLRAAIDSGVFRSGQRFPSIRSTAKQYQLSINTVITTYRLLENEGFIEAQPQSGFYVSNRLPHIERHTLRNSSPAIHLPKRDVLDLIETNFAAQQNPQFTNLSLACPNAPIFFPKEKLRKALKRELHRQPNLLSRYALPPSSLRLRQQITRRMLAVDVLSTVEDITITHGCIDAIQLALRATTKPGDCIGLESPLIFI